MEPQSNQQNKIRKLRQWKEEIPDEKKGKFDQQQQQALIKSLGNYIIDHKITLDHVIQYMKPEDDRETRSLKMWNQICSVLPKRKIQSSFKFLKRKINSNSQREKWTKEEEQQLQVQHDKLGNNWKKIGKKLGKRSDQVKDKYRNLLKKKNKPKDDKEEKKSSEKRIRKRKEKKQQSLQRQQQRIEEEQNSKKRQILSEGQNLNQSLNLEIDRIIQQQEEQSPFQL